MGIVSPRFGVNIEKMFETTGHVDGTVLVPWLVGKVVFETTTQKTWIFGVYFFAGEDTMDYRSLGICG